MVAVTICTKGETTLAASVNCPFFTKTQVAIRAFHDPCVRIAQPIGYDLLVTAVVALTIVPRPRVVAPGHWTSCGAGVQRGTLDGGSGQHEPMGLQEARG